MSQINFYDVLGVTPDVSRVELHAAYARLLRRHHPDVAGNLPERLDEVQQAYRCLSDADARANHDRLIIENQALHEARQHRIQRRLERYDRRHRTVTLRYSGGRQWRPILLVSTVLIVIVGLLLGVTI